MSVIKEGYLEKQGHGIFSSWQKRWFVLTESNLSYYVDKTLSDKKGEYKLDTDSYVTHKSGDGYHHFLFCLHAVGRGGNDLLMAAPDFETLTSWENAIKAASNILKANRRNSVTGMQNIYIDVDPKSTNATKDIGESRRSIVISSVDSDVILKQGPLQKRGHRVKTWTNRWFVLYTNCIKYYTDNTLSQLKGEYKIDSYSYLSRKTSEIGHYFMFALYVGAAEDELLMNASDEITLQQWYDTFASVINNIRNTHETMKVYVTLYTELKTIQEPIYQISLKTKNNYFEDYFHFADMKEYNKRIRTIIELSQMSPSNYHSNGSTNSNGNIVQQTQLFPRGKKRAVFGIKLSREELEIRCKMIQSWLQELLDQFELFALLEYNENNEIERMVALLFGIKHYKILQLEITIYNLSKNVDSDDEYGMEEDEETKKRRLEVLNGAMAREVGKGGNTEEEADDDEVADGGRGGRVVGGAVVGGVSKRKSHETSKLIRLFDEVLIKDDEGGDVGTVTTASDSPHDITDGPTAGPSSSSTGNAATAVPLDNRHDTNTTTKRKKKTLQSTIATTIKQENTKLDSTLNQLEAELSALNAADASQGRDGNRHFNVGEMVTLPEKSKELYFCSIIHLSELCRVYKIACDEFKSKKHYVKALLTLYDNPKSFYFYNKQARLEIEKIKQIYESNYTTSGSGVDVLLSSIVSITSTLNKDTTSVTATSAISVSNVIGVIDTIFLDVLKRIRVDKDLYTALKYSYVTAEKLQIIVQTIQIWDNEVNFTKEDSELLNLLYMHSTQSGVFSIYVLILKYRLLSSTLINGWLNRFCALRGIPLLMSLVDMRLEKYPLNDIDVQTIIYILQCFRFMMESDTRHQVIATRGVIDLFVMCISYYSDFQLLTLQALELLSEVLIYGGENAIWQIISSFYNLSKRRNEVMYQILVDALTSCDVTIQSAIMILINSILLYERNLKNRIKIRFALYKLDFEFLSSVIIRKFHVKSKDGGGAVESAAKAPTTPSASANAAATNVEGEEDTGAVAMSKPTKKLTIRAGVTMTIEEFDRDREMLAEDGVTHINPELGSMSGFGFYAYASSTAEDVEDSSNSTGNNATTNVWQSWYPGKNVETVAKQAKKMSRRLSWGVNSSVPLNASVVAKKKLWYTLHSNGILTWEMVETDTSGKILPSAKTSVSSGDATSPDALEGTIKLNDVSEILDYCAVTTNNISNFYEYTVSIILKNGKHHYINVQNENLRDQWYVALITAHHNVMLHRTAYRLQEVEPLTVTNKHKLMKTFEKHVSIYQSVVLEDNLLIYNSKFEVITSQGSGDTNGNQNGANAGSYYGNPNVNPVVTNMNNMLDLSELLYFEYKRQKNELKYINFIKELTIYAIENYTPKEEDEEDSKGKNYPKAVPSSDRLIPRAPSLPYIPPTTRVGPANKSKSKLKQLFWTKVKPIHIHTTLWMKAMENEEVIRSLTASTIDGVAIADVTKNSSLADAGTALLPVINLELLEEKFVEANKNKKNVWDAAAGGASGGKKIVKKSINLFDGKRTQNIAIASGKLKKSAEEIYEMVLNLDPDEMTQEVNETVLNLLLPNAEEVNIIREYTGNLEDLDYGGKLFSYLVTIERLEQRLMCQRIMLNWYEELFIVQEQLSIISNALLELTDDNINNTYMIHLLSIVLYLGNYMNGSSIRGNAYGFKLDILFKLKNIKPLTGQGSLLHFVVEQMEYYWNMYYQEKMLQKDITATGDANILDDRPNSTSTSVSDNSPTSPPNQITATISTRNSSHNTNGSVIGSTTFYSHWKDVWRATKVNMKGIEVVMKSLETGLDYCVKEMEVSDALISDERVKSPLVSRLGQFIAQSSEAYRTITQTFEQINKRLMQTRKYFGEELVPSPSASINSSNDDIAQSFFILFVQFADMYKLVLQELKDWKQKENKLQERIRQKNLKINNMMLKQQQSNHQGGHGTSYSEDGTIHKEIIGVNDAEHGDSNSISNISGNSNSTGGLNLMNEIKKFKLRSVSAPQESSSGDNASGDNKNSNKFLNSLKEQMLVMRKVNIAVANNGEMDAGVASQRKDMLEEGNDKSISGSSTSNKGGRLASNESKIQTEEDIIIASLVDGVGDEDSDGDDADTTVS